MRTWVHAAAAQYGWQEGTLALREELAKPEHEERTDAEIATALNAQVVARRIDVPTGKVRSILLVTGDWGPLVMASRRNPTGDAQQDAITAAAIVTVAAVEHTSAFGTERDEDAAVVEGMIATFVSAGIFQQATADRLLALMWRDDPVWSPPVTEGDVALARGLVDG